MGGGVVLVCVILTGGFNILPLMYVTGVNKIKPPLNIMHSCATTPTNTTSIVNIK